MNKFSTSARVGAKGFFYLCKTGNFIDSMEGVMKDLDKIQDDIGSENLSECTKDDSD